MYILLLFLFIFFDNIQHLIKKAYCWIQSIVNITLQKQIKNTRAILKKLQKKIKPFNPDTFDQNKYDPYFSYNNLLTKPDIYFSKQLKLSNLEIKQVTHLENATVYVAYTADGDPYMLFLENERVKSELLEGDDVTFFCRFIMNSADEKTSGSVSYHPIMYVDEYILNN